MSEIPTAFLAIGIILNALAFIVTLIISMMSYKIHRIFDKPKYRHLSIGFFLFSISYLFFTITDILSYLYRIDPELFINQDQFNTLFAIFFNLRIIAVISGLLLLIFLYYDISHKGPRALLIIMTILFFFMDNRIELVFFAISTLFLLFITFKLQQNYLRQPERTGLFITLGFWFLLIAKLLDNGIIISNELFLASYCFKLVGVLAILYSLKVILE